MFATPSSGRNNLKSFAIPAIVLTLLAITLYFGSLPSTPPPLIPQQPVVSQGPVVSQQTVPSRISDSNAYVLTFLDKDGREIPDERTYVLVGNANDDPIVAYQEFTDLDRLFSDHPDPVRSDWHGADSPLVYFGANADSPIIVRSHPGSVPVSATDYRIAPMKKDEPFVGWTMMTVADFQKMQKTRFADHDVIFVPGHFVIDNTDPETTRIRSRRGIRFPPDIRGAPGTPGSLPEQAKPIN